MSQQPKYCPLDPKIYTRFTGIRTFMKLPFLNGDLSGADFAVVGIPCDLGATFRSGAAFGPAAIREMSIMLRSGNPNLEVDIFDYLSGVDYGDVNTDPCSLPACHAEIEKVYDEIVGQGVMPIGLGGDHSVTLPQLRAIAKKYGPVALVQFDSHLDTNDIQNGNRLTHGTMFRRAAEEGLIDTRHSVQVGIRGIYGIETIRESEDLGFTVITAHDLHENGIDWAAAKILETVGDKKTHFTFDIDFFDPAYAPGTGTIEVGGFTSYEGLKLTRSIRDLDFVSFDLVEVLPAFDPTQITAYLGGCCVHEFLSMLAWKRKQTSAL
ncbi:agmatinase [Anaerotruncus rubiinfantis]|uniref:agmatinase n=1 Tax=Anaerotruncus rubiinfantis TaxID=1720200 RepID=UPI000829EFB7|nr:agmatinase [Anaerotruncus rubiinfantis]